MHPRIAVRRRRRRTLLNRHRSSKHHVHHAQSTLTAKNVDCLVTGIIWVAVVSWVRSEACTAGGGPSSSMACPVRADDHRATHPAIASAVVPVPGGGRVHPDALHEALDSGERELFLPGHGEGERWKRVCLQGKGRQDGAAFSSMAGPGRFTVASPHPTPRTVCRHFHHHQRLRPEAEGQHHRHDLPGLLRAARGWHPDCHRQRRPGQ